MTNEIITVPADRSESFFLTPAIGIESILTIYQAKKDFVEKILKEGVDYGTIPGAGQKPTLLKPGAEKLASFFALAPTFHDIEKVEDWTGAEHNGEPFFYYRIKCQLSRNGMVIGEADGSCNSWEVKYRYRWAKAEDLPPHIEKQGCVTRDGGITEFGFAIDKAETSGKYGKPVEYWQRFRDAIASRTAIQGTRDTSKGKSVTWTIGTTLYRVPNTDIAEQVNTILKMAQKRALVAATLIATNASDGFTQDLDDFADKSYEPPMHNVAATSTPTEPPKKTDWMKLVAAAATLQAVRELARLAQEEVGYMPDELLHACQKRETELTPKPQTAPKTEQPKPATNGSRFDWNKATPDERTAYTLKIVPTADGERIAKMSKIITPSVVGQENYRKIQEAMTARERELAQPQTEADPFGESEQIAMLRMLLQDKTTAADFDDMAKRWQEDSHSIDEPTYAQGVEIIQQARVSKGV